MSDRRYRKPSALRHGAFSQDELLPWEDAGEFQKLLEGLIEEHQPKGSLEADCVNTIASLLWRKRRVRAKRNFNIADALACAENLVSWEDPPPLFDTKIERTMHALARDAVAPPPRDDYQPLLGFSRSLYRQLDGDFVELQVKILPEEFSDHLNEKVQSKNVNPLRIGSLL